MYAIRTATAEDQPAVVALLSRLQADPEQHIGYHGTTVEEIDEELSGFAPDWASGAVLAVDGDRVRGVLSVEADAGTGRAWLHGPYVDVPETHPAGRPVWQDTADALFDRALAVPRMRGIADLELFGHRRHRLLADFAARQGFTSRGASRVFTLEGSALRSVLVGDIDPTVRRATPEHRDQVVDLHERCFPQTATTGTQMLDGAKGHTVVVRAGADGVLGYAAGFAQAEELYVDYVAVDPNFRAVGAGRALVRGLVRELAAEHGPRPRAAAVISLGNDASERMFTALGFDLHLELVAYRRRP